MKQKGINRIVIGVWDFEKGKDYFERLLGAEFAPENTDGEAAAFEYAPPWLGNLVSNLFRQYPALKVT